MGIETTVCFLWTTLGLASGKISDACHGIKAIDQTSNLLECGQSLVICIDEVRFYQYNPKSGCPYVLSAPAHDCCNHNNSPCSWVRNNAVNDTEDLQKQCMNKNRCKLHSLNPAPVAVPCEPNPSAPVSSVRSITYTCRRSCVPQTTLPTTKITAPSRMTEKESTISFTTRGSVILPSPGSTQEPRTDGPRIIVGGVIGGLVGCGVLFTLIILFNRRKVLVNKPTPSIRTPDVTDTVAACGR